MTEDNDPKPGDATAGFSDSWETPPWVSGSNDLPDESPAGDFVAEPLLPGEMFGNFRVEGRIGGGGMGHVYRAMQTTTERVVALKVARSDANPARLRREPIALAWSRHAHVVEVHDAGVVVRDGRPVNYIAMEYVEGASLREHVDELSERGERLPIDVACDFARQVALGLAHAHANGVIHRDIKPDNLMLTEDGTRVKIADFGLARIVRPGRQTQTLTVGGLGTWNYMAPEQARQAHTVDARADVYSLGRTLLFLLMGRAPLAIVQFGQPVTLGGEFEIRIDEGGDDVSEDLPPLPRGLARVLARLTAIDPDDRYPGAAEAAQALEPFCRAETGGKARMRLATVAAVVALLGLIAAGGYLFPRGRTSDTAPVVSGKGHPSGIGEGDPSNPDLADPRGPEDKDGGGPVLPTDGDGPQPPKVVSRKNSIGMELVRLEGGEFVMGADDVDAEFGEGPAHRVRLTQPFELGRFEVTQGQYRRVYRDDPGKPNPSHFQPGRPEFKAVPGEEPDSLPVENVSWLDAIDFCNKLSEIEGLKPYYRVLDRVIPDAQRLSTLGYRLPTEAEWEYAAKAGSNAPFCFGDARGFEQRVAGLGPYAWFADNSDERTHPVGFKKSNKFGLFDMNGNVNEWVWDRFGSRYYADCKGRGVVEDPNGPEGPENPGENFRIDRFGSFMNPPFPYLRNTARHNINPAFTSKSIGFRVARSFE